MGLIVDSGVWIAIEREKFSASPGIELSSSRLVIAYGYRKSQHMIIHSEVKRVRCYNRSVKITNGVHDGEH